MNQDDATIVVVLRDHFSDSREALESILEFTRPMCPLVYVDGGAPPGIARYLRERASAENFELIRSDRYLTPNQARNIGAARVKTRYFVFIDNDVVVAPDWLPPLVECADATGAAIVGPLNFEKRPLHQIVHFAGGAAEIAVSDEKGRQRRRLVDRMYKTRIPSSATPTGCAEFHCMMVRTDFFRRLGGLDEKMLSTRENIDFCLAVSEAGGKIYLEPRSKITYLPPERMSIADVPYFALRWSDLWDLSSFYHLRDKWNLEEDEYFRRQYANLGWRRQGLMMRGGLLRWLGSYRIRAAAERMLRPLERRVNAALARSHAKRHGVPIQMQ
jgi:GT2 family glycosyltransferase